MSVSKTLCIAILGAGAAVGTAHQTRQARDALLGMNAAGAYAPASRTNQPSLAIPSGAGTGPQGQGEADMGEAKPKMLAKEMTASPEEYDSETPNGETPPMDPNEFQKMVEGEAPGASRLMEKRRRRPRSPTSAPRSPA